MELRQLEYFRAIVDAGTISGAARMLHMTQPPLSFVQHQRCSFDEDLFRQSRRNTDRAVQMLRKTIFFFVSVRADQHDRHLHVTGQHRCDCRADNAELRCTEFSVD